MQLFTHIYQLKLIPPTGDVKFRASWGCTGNQGGIGSYAYQALAGGGYNYNGENGLGLTTAGNRDLK